MCGRDLRTQPRHPSSLPLGRVVRRSTSRSRSCSPRSAVWSGCSALEELGAKRVDLVDVARFPAFARVVLLGAVVRAGELEAEVEARLLAALRVDLDRLAV